MKAKGLPCYQTKERSVNFYTSTSESGKFWQIGELVVENHRLYPDNEIFLISSENEGENPAYYPRLKKIINFIKVGELSQLIAHKRVRD